MLKEIIIIFKYNTAFLNCHIIFYGKLKYHMNKIIFFCKVKYKIKLTLEK